MIYLALALGLGGGAVLAAGFVTDLSSGLLALGWAAFVLSFPVVFVIVGQDARERGASLPRSLGIGLRAAGRWFLDIFP